MYLYFNRKKNIYRYHSIRNKNRLWRPCLLSDQDEISNLYRGPSIDASYQVSVHLAKRFQRRRLKKIRTIRKKNRLWRPCLLMDRDKISNLYGGSSIYDSCQVSVHMIEGFQRRILKCEMLTDDRRRTTDAKSSLCLWQGELKNWFTRHETDRFLNDHCQECVRAYLSIHDCLSFLHDVMIGNHRNKTTES